VCSEAQRCNSPVVGFFFGSHGETPGELLITDGLGGSEEGQKRVDLLGRQGVDNLMKTVRVTHDLLHCPRCATSPIYRDRLAPERFHEGVGHFERPKVRDVRLGSLGNETEHCYGVWGLQFLEAP